MTCRRDHKHEHGLTTYCYNNGCRCESCAAGWRKYNRRRKLNAGRDIQVPAVGTERRLQALAWMGWPMREIAEQLGESHMYLMHVRNGDRKRVFLSRARKVAEFYSAHQFERHPGPRANHVHATAVSRGWVSPLAWDEIDNPNEMREAA